MAQKTHIRQQALQVMGSVSAVVLTTLAADGYPDSRAMLNLRNSELFPQFVGEYASERNPLMVYLTTNFTSGKMAQIAADSRAALYFCEPRSFLGVTLQGRLEVIGDPEFKRRIWREEWEEYYPGGVESEDFVMLRFVPHRVKVYDGNLNTQSEEL